jgi:hypothetical protein
MSKNKINRLIWDIETSPNVGLFWRPGYKVSLSHDNIIQERAIICICWKWEGSRKVEHLEWDKGCDKKLCEDFMEVALQADELVAHNGDKYDIKFFNGRCVAHGLDPSPIWKTVDTLVIARRRFSFNSNRLDYIGKYLFGEGKIQTEYGMWKDILLENCPKSMKKMVKYCKQDVNLLERVWKKLEPYHRPKTHVGCANGRDKWTSPYTGSENVVKWSTRVTTAGTKQHQMKCNDTGGYFNIPQKVYEDYQDWRKDQKKKQKKSA